MILTTDTRRGRGYNSQTLAALVALFVSFMLPAVTCGQVSDQIDQLLSATWKEKGLEPSPAASDQEFIRRATLDIIGRIATPEEVRAFENDKRPDKRARLIDRLLRSDEYPRYWAKVWSAWLIGRGGPPNRRQQLQAWLEKKFADDAGLDTIAIGLIAATGEGSENGAVHYILAHLGEPVPENKQMEEGRYDMVPLTLRTLQFFLGLRLQHNPRHPLHPDYYMRHFWRINVFFRQVDPGENSVADNPKLNPEAYIVYENREGKIFSATPRFLDDRKFDPKKGTSRRQQLASFVVSHPNFARAYVNRMWGKFFGRGLHEKPAVDDFGTHHKVIHPELLEALAKAFRRGGHRPKELVRWICHSRAYQLSSVANKTNAGRDALPYFSRMPLRIMSPEQLLESIIVATRAKEALAKNELAALRDGAAKMFDFDTELGEWSFADNLQLAFAMINNKHINDAIVSPKGTVAHALKASQGKPERIIDELYLAALNRSPNDKEKDRVMTIIKESAAKKEIKDWTPLWQDLLWALINSNEFILNH